MRDAPPIAGSAAWPSAGQRPVVTIGNFDGVHLGHRALLDRTVALARELGGLATAFTFDPAPRDVLRPDNPIRRIQTLDDRVDALRYHGMDRVVIEPFDRDYAAHDAAWFATEILGRRLDALAVVVGWDFRFGRGRSGSVETLRDMLGVPVEQVPQLQRNGEPVSSSRIRQLLAAGQVRAAAELLDRDHSVVGTVVHGDARGRTLGFATANVRPDTPLVPKPGVYAVRVDPGGGTLRPAVANIGVRPTFGPGGLAVEVHVLDWSGDLYDQRLRVHFGARIRDERRFAGVDELVAQIDRDVLAARDLLSVSPR